MNSAVLKTHRALIGNVALVLVLALASNWISRYERSAHRSGGTAASGPASAGLFETKAADLRCMVPSECWMAGWLLKHYWASQIEDAEGLGKTGRAIGVPPPGLSYGQDGSSLGRPLAS
jgi:hypothetical protein